jgi:hypothetical protein
MARHDTWPTPRSQDGKHAAATDYEMSRDPNKDLLHVQVADYVKTGNSTTPRWPTPTTQDAHNNGGSAQLKRNSLPLNAAIKWPTPKAWDGNNRGGQARYDGTSQNRRSDLSDRIRATENSGSLNPTWVEWLMGFPLGWTDLGR